jgi:hypothetical protein
MLKGSANIRTMNNELVVGKIEFGRTPKAPEDFLSVDHVINDAVALRMYKALSVIALNPNISSILSNLDPKALQQVEDAREEYQASYQFSNIDNL